MSTNQKTSGAEALIAKFQKDAAEEAAKILATAKEQATAITREARGKARSKVHTAVKNLRNHEEREMAHEIARFETERRKWRQTDDTKALAEGLTHLEAALNGLWAEKDSRIQWCQNIVAIAKQRLPAGNWQVQHPANHPQEELAILIGEIVTHTGVEPICTPDDALSAGLRIYAGTASIDGSIDAMTADRQRTSAKFLSVLLAMREESTT